MTARVLIFGLFTFTMTEPPLPQAPTNSPATDEIRAQSPDHLDVDAGGVFRGSL